MGIDIRPTGSSVRSAALLVATLTLAVAIYFPGLSGGYLFDDFPNIVDNESIHMNQLEISQLTSAALSSPSSDLKRPLASISFALNHLATGLNPFWMKLTNLIIHLLNGALVFFLSRLLLRTCEHSHAKQSDLVSLLVAACWLVLPINLTAVLYVVQRMEAIANLFVLLGLIGYVGGRLRVLAGRPGLLICSISLIASTVLGVLAKESAITLPLYAFFVEIIVFRWRGSSGADARIIALFVALLAVPLTVGLAWLLPPLLDPATWASRDFTLGERLLSEARIVCGYIAWTLLPRPDWLTFHHDDFIVSKGLLEPWTTLVCGVVLVLLLGFIGFLRKRIPIMALGLAFFLGGHVLTGTILPLELLYEHRNYFPSFGLMLAVVPVLAPTGGAPFALPRRITLLMLMTSWIMLTAMTAHAWGHPLRLASELAIRNPDSPRAQYELGHAYVVASGYRPDSPFIPLAREQLTKASSLPRSSVLPEHALIIMNARLGAPLKDAWWESLENKLTEKKPSMEDIGALVALSRCSTSPSCSLPVDHMVRVFIAALSHPNASPWLLSNYASYSWNVLKDPDLARNMAAEAADSAPREPAHLITLIQILTELGEKEQAVVRLQQLRDLNFGGRLTTEILALEEQIERL